MRSQLFTIVLSVCLLLSLNDDRRFNNLEDESTWDRAVTNKSKVISAMDFTCKVRRAGRSVGCQKHVHGMFHYRANFHHRGRQSVIQH